MGELKGMDGKLAAAAWLYSALGNRHVTQHARESGQYNVNSEIISNVVDKHRGLEYLNELDDEERAVGAVELAHAALPPIELDRFTAKPGGPGPRGELRTRAGCWGAKEGKGKMERLAIEQGFATVTSSFWTISAMVGGKPSGTALAATAGEAFAVTDMVEQRIGVLSQQAVLNLGNMRALEARVTHLCGMLEAAG